MIPNQVRLVHGQTDVINFSSDCWFEADLLPLPQVVYSLKCFFVNKQRDSKAPHRTCCSLPSHRSSSTTCKGDIWETMISSDKRWSHFLLLRTSDEALTATCLSPNTYRPSCSTPLPTKRVSILLFPSLVYFTLLFPPFDPALARSYPGWSPVRSQRSVSLSTGCLLGGLPSAVFLHASDNFISRLWSSFRTSLRCSYPSSNNPTFVVDLEQIIPWTLQLLYSIIRLKWREISDYVQARGWFSCLGSKNQSWIDFCVYIIIVRGLIDEFFIWWVRWNGLQGTQWGEF